MLAQTTSLKTYAARPANSATCPAKADMNNAIATGIAAKIATRITDLPFNPTLYAGIGVALLILDPPRTQPLAGAVFIFAGVLTLAATLMHLDEVIPRDARVRARKYRSWKARFIPENAEFWLGLSLALGASAPFASSPLLCTLYVAAGSTIALAAIVTAVSRLRH